MKALIVTGIFLLVIVVYTVGLYYYAKRCARKYNCYFKKTSWKFDFEFNENLNADGIPKED